MTDFATRYGPWGLVAGASDGTGAAFAEELAARGVNVVLVARRRPLLDELAARLPTETRVVVQDLSTPTRRKPWPTRPRTSTSAR